MKVEYRDIEIELKSGPLESYPHVQPRRSGTVTSLSLWYPATPTEKRFYTRFNASETVRFFIYPDNLYLENPQDELLVEIGTGEYTPKIFEINNYTARAAVGKYMAITFITTSQRSGFRLKYRVEPTSRIAHDTATKASGVTFGLSVFVLLIALSL